MSVYCNIGILVLEWMTCSWDEKLCIIQYSGCVQRSLAVIFKFAAAVSSCVHLFQNIVTKMLVIVPCHH
jgi:hypothetical protein